MKNTQLMNKIGGTFSKVGFQLKKHSPEILVAAGVIGTVVSAVMACKASTKVGKVIEENKNNVEAVHEALDNGITNAGEEYSVEDSKKDLITIHAKTGVELVKLYAPAVALGTLSIASILTSNHILRKRNVALAAAYATVDRGFKEYRNRVVDRFGEKVDRELKFNIKAKEIEEKVINENGEEETVKTTVEMTDYIGSEYAKFFDESNPNWEKNAEYNLMFLKAQERYANDLLKSKGRLFLNEVYDMLGIPRTKAGQVVGWVYNEKDPVGDNFVDFGIHNAERAAVRRFVNGYERVILLDFNVDGNVWENM